jgi:hypothetical protein
MKKEEVYVVIDSEEKRLRAIQILSDAGEKIWEDSCLFEIYSEPFILAMSKNKEWCVMIRIDDEINISLDQLEQLLSPKQEPMKLDALKLIAESYGFELVDKQREVKVGDFGKFSSENKIYTNFGFLKSIERGYFIEQTEDNCISSWSNFCHLTEEEKQAIQQNW